MSDKPIEQNMEKDKAEEHQQQSKSEDKEIQHDDREIETMQIPHDETRTGHDWSNLIFGCDAAVSGHINDMINHYREKITLIRWLVNGNRMVFRELKPVWNVVSDQSRQSVDVDTSGNLTLWRYA